MVNQRSNHEKEDTGEIAEKSLGIFLAAVGHIFMHAQSTN